MFETTKSYHVLREDVFRFFAKMAVGMHETLRRKQNTNVRVEGEKYIIPYHDPVDMYGRMNDMAIITTIAKDAQTIVFPQEQASIFARVHQDYFESLDFKLPFPKVFLQFSKPVLIDYKLRMENDINRGRLVAIAMDQETLTREQIKADQIKAKKNHLSLGIEPPVFYDFDFCGANEMTVNRVVFLYEDWGIDRIAWQSSNTDETLKNLDKSRFDAISLWKNIAIACIGYINCENVYLHKEGEVSAQINAKRERKGKSRLEPYYVCRIRGVQYNTDGTEKGTGSKQSIRYDVRGHFRHLESGKTTWVRPHQRGLQNELYVPKTYLVDRVERTEAN